MCGSRSACPARASQPASHREHNLSGALPFEAHTLPELTLKVFQGAFALPSQLGFGAALSYVGEAAIVIDFGAFGGKVSFGLISAMLDSELSTDSPPVPNETVRTK